VKESVPPVGVDRHEFERVQRELRRRVVVDGSVRQCYYHC
jgi:hypothetical protein